VKKIIECCTLIRLAQIYPLEPPKITGEKCEGYHDQSGKPHRKCKKCKASIYDEQPPENAGKTNLKKESEERA